MVSSVYDRNPKDAYWTEPWVTRALLEQLHLRGVVWEPATGTGQMAYEIFDHGYTEVYPTDIVEYPECMLAEVVDFLKVERPWPGTIITNPPYTLAEEFVRHALKLTRPEGMVTMLLRNEWDCAASRRDLFENAPFKTKYVLTKRPRWAASNKASPRHNFAWFVWDWAYSGVPEIKYLPALKMSMKSRS